MSNSPPLLIVTAPVLLSWLFVLTITTAWLMPSPTTRPPVTPLATDLFRISTPEFTAVVPEYVFAWEPESVTDARPVTLLVPLLTVSPPLPPMMLLSATAPMPPTVSRLPLVNTGPDIVNAPAVVFVSLFWAAERVFGLAMTAGLLNLTESPRDPTVNESPPMENGPEPWAIAIELML